MIHLSLIALVSLDDAPSKAPDTLTGAGPLHESNGKKLRSQKKIQRQRIAEGLADAQHSGQGQTCQKQPKAQLVTACIVSHHFTNDQYISIQYTFKLHQASMLL